MSCLSRSSLLFLENLHSFKKHFRTTTLHSTCLFYLAVANCVPFLRVTLLPLSLDHCASRLQLRSSCTWAEKGEVWLAIKAIGIASLNSHTHFYAQFDFADFRVKLEYWETRKSSKGFRVSANTNKISV